MTNDLSLSICTFHLGNQESYEVLLKEVINGRERKGTILNYENAEQYPAGVLVNEKCDVYCLQNVEKPDERRLIQLLKDKERSYTIIKRAVGEVASLLAINSKRFKNIKDHSIDVADCNRSSARGVAIATAVDIKTGLKVAFVSAHVFGIAKSAHRVSAVDAVNGDMMCRDIKATLLKIGATNIQIIGADMNISVENYKPRFELFKTDDWQLVRPKKSTKIDNNLREESDYVLVKFCTQISILSRLKSIFKKAFFPLDVELKDSDLIKFDKNTNCSNHLPVFVKINLDRSPSKIFQLCLIIMNFFSYCFRKKEIQRKPAELSKSTYI